MPPELIVILSLYGVGLAWVGWLACTNARRIRVQEATTQNKVTRLNLDDWGQALMVKMDERFDAMEEAQTKREQDRMAYLLKNAEELGGVRSTNQLLTGQLGTLAAKLDRQIELAAVRRRTTTSQSARRDTDHPLSA